MREVVWKCDWCHEGESRGEEMPSHWNVLVAKIWDGTEINHPEAFLGKRVLHFCSEIHRSCWINDGHYEKHE